MTQNFQKPPNAPNLKVLAPGIIQEQPDLHSYAEFGCLYGDTVVSVAKALAGREAQIHLFDFEDVLMDISERLIEADMSLPRVHWYPNTRRTKDSYCWSMLKLLEKNPAPIFDYVFLDGAHTYDIDGFALCLIERLLKSGGYLEVDDYNWTMANSPTMGPTFFPTILEWYTEEQIAEPNIKLVVDTLVRDSQRYTVKVPGRLYRKK